MILATRGMLGWARVSIQSQARSPPGGSSPIWGPARAGAGPFCWALRRLLYWPSAACPPFLGFFWPPILLPHVPPPGCPALRPGSMWFNGHPGACTKAIGGRERGACGGSTETKLMLALPNWQSSLALCTGIMAYPLVESVYSFPSCRTHSLSWEALDSFLWPYTHTYIVWRSVANLLNRFSCLNPGPAGKLLRPYPPEEKDSLFFCPSFLSVANHLAYDIATTDSPPWLVFLENIRVARPVAAAASR